MAMENIQSYKVSMAFDEAYKKLNKFQKKSQAFNKVSEASLKRQVALYKQLGIKKPTLTPQEILPKTAKDPFTAHLKAREKHLNKAVRQEESLLKKREAANKSNRTPSPKTSHLDMPKGGARAKDTAFADMLRKEEALSKEQAKRVANQPKMDAHLKAREQYINTANKAEAQRVKHLERARRVAKQHNIMLGDTEDKQVLLTRAAIKERITKAKTADEVRYILKEEVARLKTTKKTTAQMNKQNFLLRRMKSSSEQVAGNMVSAFAVAAGVSGVTRIGQDFESVRNTMLAVSDSAEQSGENFKFVRNEAYRLGLGLQESAKGFAKMVAARGDMTIDQTKDAFSGLSEMTTLLGLSAEESSRAVNALMQMMSKGVVTSEELKLQMGEVLPNAIPLMAKAAKDAGISVSGTVAELFQLQQQGAVISSKVLPFFAKRMSKAAQANGGLEKALESSRVAMNRFMFGVKEGADTFFKGGYAEGLSDFFNSSSKSIVELAPLWKALGRIVGSALKTIAFGVKVITPVLSAFGTILEFVTDILKDFSVILTPAFAPFLTGALVVSMRAVASSAGGVGKMFKSMFLWTTRVLTPLLLIIGALEELANYYGNGDKIGILPTKASQEANLDKFISENPSYSGVRGVGGKKDYGILDFLGDLGGMFDSKTKTVGSYNSMSGIGVGQPIQVNVQIDGDTVAEAVVERPAFDQGVERKLHPYLTGEY